MRFRERAIEREGEENRVRERQGGERDRESERWVRKRQVREEERDRRNGRERDWGCDSHTHFLPLIPLSDVSQSSKKCWVPLQEAQKIIISRGL